MRILTLVTLLLAAPAVVSAQTSLLAGARSALMIQVGADLSDIDQKAGDTELIHFDGYQTWGAVTGMFAAGPRNSFLLGVSLASAAGTVINPGRFAVSPGTAYYTNWDQRGHTLRLQAGTIIWFK